MAVKMGPTGKEKAGKSTGSVYYGPTGQKKK